MASRVLGAFVVAGTAVLASLALTTPAFAHTPAVNVECDEAGQKSVLSVELKDYNTYRGKNTLTVEVDGKQVDQIKFDNGLPTKKWPTTSTDDHTYKVTVLASDDPDLENKNPYWSRVFTLDNKKCVKTPPATTTKPVKQVTTTTEAPSSSAPSSTPTAPAPGGSTPEPPLAATGASPMWLLLSGLGLVGAGAGTLLFLRRRRSA